LTLDAKYKLYDERRLSTADIYQSVFYAYTYNDAAERSPAVLLLYPSSGQQKQAGYLQIRGQDGRVKAHLQALSIPIPQAAVEIRENEIGSVSRMLSEAIEYFLVH
jgi:5-methylcytosine-specific restriction enzyme subunit McrC